jgi:hypothetical protein
MACTPVVTIPRGEYSRKKSRTKKTRRRFLDGAASRFRL